MATFNDINLPIIKGTRPYVPSIEATFTPERIELTTLTIDELTQKLKDIAAKVAQKKLQEEHDVLEVSSDSDIDSDTDSDIEFDFWKVVGELNWHDKDEGPIDITHAKSKINKSFRDEYTTVIIPLADKLKDEGYDDHLAVASHIVASGRAMYDFAMDDAKNIEYMVTGKIYRDFGKLVMS